MNQLIKINNKGKLFIFLIILWNSQILSGTGGNPLGIKGIQEIFYIILFLFATAYLLAQLLQREKIFKIDFIVYCLVLIALFYSAFAAYVRFGQPFLYGLIEERRVLAFLIYFPLSWGFRNQIMTIKEVLLWMLISAIICSILSVAVVYGIIPPLHVKDVTMNMTRENRYGIGQLYIAFSILYLVFMMGKKITMYNIISLLLLVYVLVAIVQTRQIIISLFIALFFLKSKARLVVLVGLSSAFLIAVLFTDMTGLLKFQAMFVELTSEKYMAESARSLTISVIIDQFLNGAYFGSGALSLLWNDGFRAYYHSTFFLADVGIFGSLYKFGILTVLFMVAYIKLQYNVMKRISMHPYYRLILAFWVQLLMMLPVADIIEYRGFMSGLVLALSVGALYEDKKTEGNIKT